MHAELDHLVWAVPDLERGMLEVEQRFGSPPLLGGHHPGVGTRNALVEVGERRYLEILAPDPDQHSFSGFGLWVAELSAPRLVTWASRTEDLEAWHRAAAAAGLEPGEILDMQRQRPDGSSLAWRLLALGQNRDGRLPFCIEWRDRHPTDDMPTSGCRLLDLRLDRPELTTDLDALGLAPGDGLSVSHHRSGLTAVFETPRGRVELT